jgi:MFS family permease
MPNNGHAAGSELNTVKEEGPRITPNSAQEDDNIEYPTKLKLALITTGLCLSVFCMSLDNTIIATAIPRITDQFHALDDVGWYGSAYLLCTCSFQLIFGMYFPRQDTQSRNAANSLVYVGKLYTFYSIKWVYLSAILIFEVGSLICGVAPNSTALILGRAVSGLGAAGIFSGAILIITKTVPKRQRPAYTGMIGGVYGLSSVAGPLMGGAFTGRYQSILLT